MATTTMVHVRVDEELKAEATETLASMGLSLSDGVRVFLTRVVAEKQLPFVLKAPNAETRAAMAEADEVAGAHRARFATAAELFDDLEKNAGKWVNLNKRRKSFIGFRELRRAKLLRSGFVHGEEQAARRRPLCGVTCVGAAIGANFDLLGDFDFPGDRMVDSMDLGFPKIPDGKSG